MILDLSPIAAVVNLRRPLPSQGPLAGRLVRPDGTTLAATLLRVPLAAIGIAALLLDWRYVAVGAFALFAAADYADGVVARKRGADDAARRVLDVVVDRVAIHSAALACVHFYGVDLLLVLMLMARDIVQGGYSAFRLIADHLVFIGPRWHMGYGLAFLAWGSWIVITGEVNRELTVILLAVSVATFIDFVIKTRSVARTLGNRNGH